MSDLLNYYDYLILDRFTDESSSGVHTVCSVNATHVRILETCAQECSLAHLAISPSTLADIKSVVRETPKMYQLLCTRQLDKEIAFELASR